MTVNETSVGATTLRGAARDAVRDALARAIESGSLPDVPEATSVEVEVSRPAKPEHGDLAANLALKLARPLRMAPPAIATALANALAEVIVGDPGSAIG